MKSNKLTILLVCCNIRLRLCRSKIMKTKEKVESKKGKKLKIVLLVIAAIVIVAVAFINLTTLPKYDDDKNVIYVGSMVKSKTIDYKDKSGEGDN